MKRYRLFILAILAITTTALPLSAQSDLFSFLKGGGPIKMPAANKIAQAEKIIEQCYVDTVDTDQLAQEAIKAMLATLDPHSTYSDPEETKELTTPLDGNFSGIGIQFNMLNDTLYVIQTTSGGPSEKVGILPGDRLIQADDSIISGVKRPNSSVIKILRGPKGTPVNLKILRKGVAQPIDFLVVRDDIPVYSIDAAYMADPTTGYIRLSRFSESTPKEISEAMAKLRKQGMKNLVLDLQDNGGGLLGSAIDLGARFLNRNDLVVYTKSPTMGEHYYATDRDGEFRDGRVVVLVNQYSPRPVKSPPGPYRTMTEESSWAAAHSAKGSCSAPSPSPTAR